MARLALIFLKGAHVMSIIRIILLIIFGFLIVFFLLLSLLANFRTQGNIVTYKIVKRSSMYFIFALLSALLFLVAYNINSWAGAIVIFLMGLSLVGFRLLIARLSFRELRKRRTREKVVPLASSINKLFHCKRRKD